MNYRLTLTLNRSHKPDASGFAEAIAEATLDFTIPKMSGG
jgi:hypothetical protein